MPWPQFNEATSGYFGCSRFYHGTGHIDELLTRLDGFSSHAKRPGLIELAILYHDAIYDTNKPDSENVEASAALFRKHYGRGQDPEAAMANCYVERLILSTDGHRPRVLPTRHASPIRRRAWQADYDNDVALFLDLDLSPLAADGPLFDEHTRDIRLEYIQYDNLAFAIGRAGVLRNLAEREPLFLHPATKAMFEAKAKNNLNRSAGQWAAAARQLASDPDSKIWAGVSLG